MTIHAQFRKLIWLFIILTSSLLTLFMAAGAVAKLVYLQNDEKAFENDLGYTVHLKRDMPQYMRIIVTQLDLDEEQCFANWFSTCLYFISGMLALNIFFQNERRLTFHALGWFVLGSGIIFLSLEEAASIHETIGLLFGGGKAVDAGPFTWYTASVWVLIYGIPMLLVAATIVFWLFRTFEPGKLRRLTLTAIVMWSMVLMFESIQHSLPQALVRFGFLAEESFEIWGNVIFIYVFSNFTLGKRTEITSPAEIEKAA